MLVPWELIETWCCKLLGFIHAWLALAVLLGGSQRFPAGNPNYGTLLWLTGGKIWPYGLLWLGGGLLMLLSYTKARVAGLVVGILITNLWAGLFCYAALTNPHASFTPTAAYGGYGLLNTVLFALILIHIWRRKREAVLWTPKS